MDIGVGLVCGMWIMVVGVVNVFVWLGEDGCFELVCGVIEIGIGLV